MKQNYLKLGLLLSLGLLANTSRAQTLTGEDVGSPAMPGSMTLDAATKVYTIVGGGADIWGTADAFYYAYFKVTGDFDYAVNVSSHIGNSGDGGWSKAELMARQDDGSGVPQAGDPFIANMANRPSSDTANGAPAGVNNRGPQWRCERDNQCSWTTPNPAYPPNAANNWLRLERVGDVFYMYTGNDGKTWNMYNPYNPQGWDTSGSWPPGTDNPTVAFFTNAWQKTILLGLAVTAHSSDVSTVKFASFGPYTGGAPVAITAQPVASLSIAQNNKLELKVEATGDPVHYQWLKDGKAIARGVGATYTVALAQLSDAGTYTVKVFASGKEVVSSASVVAVTVDTQAPTVKGVSADSSFTGLRVEFSEPVTDTALTKGNYAMDGGLTISSVTRINESTVAFVTSKMAEGASYTLTINGIKDTANPANTIAADTKVPFFAAKFATGFASYQRWDNANGQDYALADFATAVTDGTIRSADISSTVAQFGGPWGLADNYSSRVSGFFVPPTTGDYVFFLSSDDGSYLYLSTDDKPANKKLIANEGGWSNQYQWTTPGSGDASTKRSDQFSGSEWPGGATISLKAGTKYFMEIIEDEGTGGDGSDATYVMVGDADPTQDSAGMHMRGSVIGTFVDINGAHATITTPPASTQGVEGHTVTFSVKADTFSPLSTTVSYQWLKNGTAISGATSPAYTTPKLALTDGAKYSVTVSVPGLSTTSADAILTVVADTFPPKPLASALKNQAGTYDVGIAFDEDVEPVEVAKQANYSISAGTITAFKGYKTGAALTVTGLTPGTTYTVTVKNVADLKANKIATATADFTVGKMAWGVVGGDRLKLGNGVIASGEGSFDVYSDGATEWNNYDESTFVYEQVTGDFDKKLRVEYQDSSSQWARAGLIARDVTNFGVTDAEQFGSQAEGNSGVTPFDGKACRYQKVHVNPVVTVMGTAGNNSWETNRRLETGGPSSNTGASSGTPLYPNAWCRLQRVGDLFSVYRSDDGVNWTAMGTTTFTEPMPATLYVGPDYSPENGNITDESLRGMWLAKFRDYGDTFPKTAAVTLSSARTATGLTITFTGKLQSAPAVTGPWTDVAGAASPLAITTAGKASAFYRAAQ